MFPMPRALAATAAFRRQVGSIELTVLSDGVLDVTLSFTLPETPRAEAEALLTAHGLPAARLPAQTNVSLVKTGGELVLIDAGSGSNYQATAGKLAENLEATGVDPAKITKVVFTHAHPDHLWGAIDDFDDTERFSNASYVISAAEWDFWIEPDRATRVCDCWTGPALASARILRRLEKKIERRRPGEQVAPGLTLLEAGGHTPGHVAVLLHSRGESLLIGGDVLTHVAISFARPGWRHGGDMDRDLAIVTRKRLLDQLATERMPLVGFHLPWPGHGMVERSGTNYRFVPV